MGNKLLSGWLTLCIAASLFSCKEETGMKEEIAKIPVNLEVIRFEKEFGAAQAGDIPALKRKYPYLFPDQYPDSVWISRLEDSLQRELLDEVEIAFNDFGTAKRDIEMLFKHIKFFFPGFSTPKVVTVISDVDYHNRIILTDTLLLLGVDNYLGKEHRFYGGIERYVAAGLDKRYLASDIASAFAKKVINYPEDRSFLARMIYYGKELYLKDKVLPFESEAIRIGYTEEELKWARDNEEQIWRYFIERELLYSTDLELGPRFLDPAPFSKFRLQLDNESPGRLGRYMGWQIVRAFAEKNSLSLQEVLQLPAETIFKNANYKPKK